MVRKDWLSNLVGLSIFQVAIILIDVCCVKINHIKFIGSMTLYQDKQVIGVSDVGVTNVNQLSFGGQLNSLDEFVIKHVEQEQVISKT